MKYICALLSVRDIHAAKAFYQELFGLEVAQDYGRNIAEKAQQYGIGL